MKKIIVALAAISFLPTPAQANKNLECYGVANLFGPAAQGAAFDKSEGRINIAGLFRGNPAVSFSENNFSHRLGPQAIPALGGGNRVANMEYRVGFEYEGDRLVGTNQSTHEVGRADDSFLGGATNYDWPGGNCRPTKISIKNKLLLGSASGVLFDARLCEALKKKGLDPSRGGACVADAQATFKVMQEFDSELRSATKETEVLVGGQPLLPGGLVLIGKTADTGYALQLMASCAEFARAGSISKSAKPADNFSDGTPKKGQSAK